MVFQSDGGLSKAKKTIEAVLKGLELDPGKSSIEGTGGGFAWQIARGSADVMIALNPSQGGAAPRLRLVSPIVKMRDGVPTKLATTLLTLNGTELPGLAFGLIQGDVIVLVAERSVADLDKGEVEELLRLTGFYADKYDDVLVDEFGGTRVCDLG